MAPSVNSRAAISARSNIDYETSWRSKFSTMPVLILGIAQVVLTLLIFILEIASLAVYNYQATGAGIWCSLSFIPAAILTILLVKKWDRSRFWATGVFIAQILLLVFTFILIGIVGNFVSTNSNAYSASSNTSVGSVADIFASFRTKYRIMQAQLAFAIILMFTGLGYVIFYMLITYLALWKPFHTLDVSHLFQQ
ncbi:unnamed protein product [Rotaria socialis]|uniref:Uncharacterized protein n=2 Tax=Rotaria socialis TaxID=392032 RepID=A0A818YCB4_9BILA|nr:unnamed protein product [Rotaria socialis]CAF3752839.1 unnamed protein product [Rotaria socialis]